MRTTQLSASSWASGRFSHPAALAGLSSSGAPPRRSTCSASALKPQAGPLDAHRLHHLPTNASRHLQDRTRASGDASKSKAGRLRPSRAKQRGADGLPAFEAAGRAQDRPMRQAIRPEAPSSLSPAPSPPSARAARLVLAKEEGRRPFFLNLELAVVGSFSDRRPRSVRRGQAPRRSCALMRQLAAAPSSGQDLPQTCHRKEALRPPRPLFGAPAQTMAFDFGDVRAS